MKKVVQLFRKQTLCLFLISSVSTRQTFNFLFKRNPFGFGTVFFKNAVAVFSLGMLLMGQVSVGQTTATYDFSQSGAAAGLNSVSPGITVDANIGFGSFKNSGTSNPTINSGQLRLYQNASKGGSIKVYAKNGVTISSVIFYASGTTGPAQYSVNGSGSTSLSINGSTYTISAISATSEVEFWCVGSTSGSRIYVDKFDVIYTMPSATPTLITPTATGITTGGANLGATISANGGSAITARGTVWSTSAAPVANLLAEGGTAAGTFNHTRSGMSVNTLIYYRGYATNGSGTAYSPEGTFYTLANVPLAPTVSNPQITTLDVAFNTTDGNPASTQYALYELNTNTYVQANGTLGTSAVWNTLAGWSSNIVVNGLTANTAYDFFTRARNGANIPTEFSADAGSGSTLVSTVPTIETSTLTAFAATCINTSALVQPLEVYGYNLNSTSVVVGPLNGFAFSSNNGVSYTSQVSVVPDLNGEVLQEVLVRFTPTAVQSYNGTIPVSGGGASTVNVSVTGSGINTAPTVASPTSTAVAATTATLGGTITVAGCSAITERGIYYSTTAGFADGAGTKVSETGSFATGAFTINTAALTSNTVYYYKAFATSASSGTAYSTQGTFTTACGVATVPFSQNFESVTTPALPTCSTLQNAGTGNNWITSAINADGFASQVLEYTYDINNAANAWYYTQGISLTAGITYQISYKYGNNSTAYIEKLKVAYGTATVNTAMTNALADYPNISGASAVTATNYFVAPATGVFYFGFNAYSDANQFDLYVDDIAIDVAPTCVVPITLTSTALTSTTATLSWTASVSNPVDGYDYYYATSATAPNGLTTPSGSVASGVTTANLSGLSSSTTYYFWVRSNCGSGDTSTWTPGSSFITAALSAPVANVAADVTSTSFTASWNAVAGATGYVLDVYQSSQTASSTTETFTAIGGGTTSSYLTRSWTGVDGITWAGYKSRTDQVVNTGNDAITLRDESGAYLESGEISGVLQQVSFDVKQVYSGSGGAVTLTIFSGVGFATSTAVGTYSYSTTAQTITAPIAPSIEGPFKIEIRNNTTARPVIDNLKIDRLVGDKVYFSQNQNVGNTNSFLVTGINPETQYYYVVRATDGTASANSTAIEVNTLLAPITWNGTAWSNTVGPDATADAVIDGNYSSTADLICKDLTVNAGKVLTIKATHTLTVNGNMTNNGSIVFESTAAGTGNFAPYTGAAIAGTGTVTAERYVPAKRAYRILTTPLTGATNNTISANWQGTIGEGLLLFSPANYQSQTMVGYTTGGVAPNIRKYNGGWSNITDLTTEPMYGAAATDTKPFLVFVTGADGSENIASGSAATTLRPMGQLITGTVNHNGLAANTFYALANPYASAISPASLIANNPGQKLWLIDPALGTFGGYATFDGADWTPSTPSGNAVNIQSGQGFFIRSASAASFAIAESDKVAGSSTLWFGRNAVESATVVQKDKIRVLLYKQVANDFQLADGILSVNYADGTNDVDAMDTNKISNFNESIMFRNNTTNLAIEHRALPQVGDVQQMRMTSTTASPYQLRVFTEGYTNSTLQPYVEDTATGALTAIPTDGSEVIVPFTGLVSNATTPDLRFRIVYQTNLSTTAPSLTNVKVYPNPVVNGQLHINLGADTTNAKYTITNLLGQSVQQGELATTQNTINVPTLTKGMYILNISQEERSYTTKIYVQ